MKHPISSILPCIVAAMLLSMLFSTAIHAQPVDSVGISTVSNVQFSVTNNGIIAYNPSARAGSFIAPRGSKSQYLFGGGLWFGAQRIVGDTVQRLVFSTYNPVTNRSAAMPGDAFTNDTAAPPIVYHSTDYDRWNGTPSAGNGKPNWPLWLQPTQLLATPLLPGDFEPVNSKRIQGEYRQPAFVGVADEQFTVRYHDRDLTRYETSIAAATERGYPIGLQVQQNIYAWQSDPLKHVVVVQYAITNISGQTLSECVVAQISDPDIGQHRGNDHAVFYTRDPSLRACYAWSDTEQGEKLGALATVILEAPTVQPGAVVGTDSRTDYRNLGRVGCFATWRRSDSIPYPVTDLERATLLQKQSFAPDTTAGDQVVLLGSHPFTMKPGDVAHFAVAYVVLDSVPNRAATGNPNGTAAMGAMPELEELVREAEEAYYQQPTVSSAEPLYQPSTVALPTMRLFPNPTDGLATVRFFLPSSSNTGLRVFNNLGEQVAGQELGTLAAGEHSLPLTMELPRGVYLLELTAGAERNTCPFVVQ
ncbi:MAG: T9SS type A sorting domain-containing protein [Armatimonadetes bacterium]|nr:T9SS type A sorting domain-containing protein [Armatimonadota bacterium]